MLSLIPATIPDCLFDICTPRRIPDIADLLESATSFCIRNSSRSLFSFKWRLSHELCFDLMAFGLGLSAHVKKFPSVAFRVCIETLCDMHSLVTHMPNMM